jgi:hypothetical protein
VASLSIASQYSSAASAASTLVYGPNTTVTIPAPGGGTATFTVPASSNTPTVPTAANPTYTGAAMSDRRYNGGFLGLFMGVAAMVVL